MTGLTEDAHWAPPQLMLAKRMLTHAGHLGVTWAQDGPADRRTAEIAPSQPLPAARGLYALVEAGVVRYVGFSEHLARTFGPRGLGRCRPQDRLDARRTEDSRLHDLIVASARNRRIVDVYVLLDESPTPRWWRRRQPAHTHRDLSVEAATIGAATNGHWQREPVERPASAVAQRSSALPVEHPSH